MALVCELCGGSNFVKKDGVFECQDCGCKYSIEEARTLMSGGAPVSSAGTNVVPIKHGDSEQIKNMIENAQSSFNAGNYSTAFSQFNDVLNLDPANVDALLYKGLSAGMQSSVARPRLVEGANYISKAMEKLIEQNKDNPLDGTFLIMMKAIIIIRKTWDLDQLCQKMFINYCSKYTDIESDRAKRVAESDCSYEYARDTLNEVRSNIDKEERNMRQNVSICVMAGSSVTLPFLKYIMDIEDVSSDPYSPVVNLIETCVNSARKVTDYSREAKDSLNTISYVCSAYKNKVTRQAKEAYWAEHAEEKAALNKEKAHLEAEIENLNRKLKPINDRITAIKRKRNAEKDQIVIGFNSQIDGIDQEISSLNSTLKSLGLFKGKEKKQIQEQINQKLDEKNSLKRKIQEAENQAKMDIEKREKAITNEKIPIQQKIDRKKERIKKIEAEFTRERRKPAE